MAEKKRAAWAVFLVLCLLCIVLSAGCGGDEDDPTPIAPIGPTTAVEYTERGWEWFEAAEFNDALADFKKAINLDVNFGEAYTGKGWTLLAQAVSTTDMQGAVGSFDNAINNGEAGADVLAGLAAANLGAGGTSLEAAIADAEAALALDPSFIFTHRESFSAADLRLIVAFAWAAKGEFPLALAASDPVLDSGIQEEIATTWSVDGITYESFTGAVLAQLHKLSAQFSG